VSGYKTITSDIIETGVSNFYTNLGENPIFINSLLQFKPAVAAETQVRFTVNYPLGIFGLVDFATPMGLGKQDEHFGGSGELLLLFT